MDFDERGFSLVRLEPNHNIKSFDCGDGDLNEFLLRDSKNYQKELLAVTYIIENATETVAFFSVLNDKISVADVESGNRWKKRIRSQMPEGKHFKSYPAMKIGRLGVSANYKGQSIGSTILDFIKNLFITKNRTGCRFITVDAYAQSLGFYEKSGFLYLTEADKTSDTRLMYFDLMQIVS